MCFQIMIVVFKSLQHFKDSLLLMNILNMTIRICFVLSHATSYTNDLYKNSSDNRILIQT